nr:hypothetical protein [Tanacetum cinerariifolium]
MATSTSCSYAVILEDTSTLVIVNQRVSDKYADKIMLLQMEESNKKTTVLDYDRSVKSNLSDDLANYTYPMYLTMDDGSVTTVRTFDNPLEVEIMRSRFMSLARLIMWYETLPAIIGRKESNDGLSKE